MSKDSQKARILRLLSRRMWVTVPDLLDLRIANFTARISDLRQEGHIIRNDKWFDRKKKCCCSRYTMED